jgi:hypothetical protein
MIATEETYRQMISEGIQGLPSEVLAEIADFVYFVRRRALEPEEFADELRNILLRQQVKELSRHEQLHLEEELEDYDRRYPRE